MVTNHLQPIVLAYLISTITPLNNISRFMVIFYSVIAFIYTLESFNKIK